MVQVKGIEMPTQISHNSTISASRNLKPVIIVGGVCALVFILILMSAYLSELHDFSLIITYLSDIQVTPVWPQIGLFPTSAH